MRRGMCLGLALACLVMSGCGSLPVPREMGDMALLRTMGVDSQEGELLVTVSTGPRARGLQGEQQPALMLSAQGRTLSAAVLSLQGLSDSYVFFGYIDQLLLGEELARQGVEPVLDYFARDVELGLGAQLWLVRETTAGEAVRSGGDEGVEGRLSTFQTDGEMGISAITRTAGEVLSDLMERRTAYVPALMCTQEGEAVSLRESGYAVLKDGALAGFLDGEAAKGLELLAGREGGDVLEVELSGETVAVRLGRTKTSCRWSDAGDTIQVTCRIQARLAEYCQPLSREELELADRQLEEQERTRIQAALKQMQAWGTDCTGLGARAALASPGQWGPQLDAGQFSEQAIEVEVQVSILDS